MKFRTSGGSRTRSSPLCACRDAPRMTSPSPVRSSRRTRFPCPARLLPCRRSRSLSPLFVSLLIPRTHGVCFSSLSALSFVSARVRKRVGFRECKVVKILLGWAFTFVWFGLCNYFHS